MVIVEGCLGPTAGRRAQAVAERVVVEQSSDRAGHFADITRSVNHQPGLPVDDRLAGAARAAGNLRHARCGRFDEDDAESLLFQAEPPVAAGHHEYIGRTDQAGKVVNGHGAEQSGR